MRARAIHPAPIRHFLHRDALPGVGMMKLTLDGALSRAIPPRYGTVVHLEGESEWSVRGARYATRPGTVGVKVPGEVYAEHARVGRSRFEVVAYEDALVDEARSALGRRVAEPRARSFDGRQDARVRPLMRLHRAFDDDASTPEMLEQALSEALVALVELTSLPSTRSECTTRSGDAVRRARTLLDERLTDTVTLDELAAHARLDKFKLCRAFREQVGLPPYAYLTLRRVSLAQELLGRGMPQAEVAARVGLYDQSQLHRHFKRIVGVTPGAYARAVR
jgi:AraC-like DNA-binding protein